MSSHKWQLALRLMSSMSGNDHMYLDTNGCSVAEKDERDAACMCLASSVKWKARSACLEQVQSLRQQRPRYPLSIPTLPYSTDHANEQRAYSFADLGR